MSVPPAPGQLGDILIVDDTPANLRLLSQILSEHGYKARAVLDGPHALTAAQTAPPDLILLDVRMPDMDGYEVCQRLKADERTRDIPILFISALSETDDKVKAFNAGGVDHITKPFQAEEVLARVATHLRLRKLQQELEETNRELEKRVEELDAFAHTVAHDIKNPLGSLVTAAEMLDLEIALPDEERQKLAHIIQRCGWKMANITDELLALASVRQSGEVNVEPLDMGQIVAEAQERLTYLVEDYQAETVLPATWPTALGHAPWVEEVWVNYLSNALKYGGRPARVELGATPLADGAIRFWIRDNGDGLGPEAQAQLFTVFKRLGHSKVEGTGLGLSIVKRIIERLGGTVGVESEGVPGQGSTFSFTLPSAAQ